MSDDGTRSRPAPRTAAVQVYAHWNGQPPRLPNSPPTRPKGAAGGACAISRTLSRTLSRDASPRSKAQLVPTEGERYGAARDRLQPGGAADVRVGCRVLGDFARERGIAEHRRRGHRARSRRDGGQNHDPRSHPCRCCAHEQARCRAEKQFQRAERVTGVPTAIEPRGGDGAELWKK